MRTIFFLELQLTNFPITNDEVRYFCCFIYFSFLMKHLKRMVTYFRMRASLKLLENLAGRNELIQPKGIKKKT